MTCREFIEFLGDYYSGGLSGEVRESFEQHLKECPECLAYVESYKETIKLSKWALCHPDDPVPEDVPDDLIKAIVAATNGK